MSDQLYPSDLTDTQWEYIKPLIPVAKPGGRPRSLDMRQMLNAIWYVTVGGIPSRMLPREYPNWKSVYHYFRQWAADGTWQRIHDTLRARVRRRAGRHKHPMAGCLDSQSVKTTHLPMATTELDATCVTVQTWTGAVAELAARMGLYFTRSEAHRRALAYVQGLVSPAERKNSWQLAEMMADATPYSFQHLLGRAVWDADALRDGLQTYVRDHLGSPEAVLVIDETGFLKKGSHSAGVARQYSGTAGRIENSQIGVFLAYRTCAGQTLIDRELYLPHAWTTDADRCQQAGIPDTRQFATKPQLAQQMLARVLRTDLPAAWITGDSILWRCPVSARLA